MTQEKENGTRKDGESQGPAINYWDEVGNLAQLLGPDSYPTKKGGEHWGKILARIVAMCDERNPGWREKK